MMKKTALPILCVLSGFLNIAAVQLNAGELHDHAAMQQDSVVKSDAGHHEEAPVMIHAGTEDLITSLGFDRLEWQKHPEGEAQLVWDFAGFIGNDTGRWWLKSEGAATNDNTEEGYVQITYSQPVSPFLDLQLGLHTQLEPGQENYLLIGMFGLAPWFVAIDSYLLLNSNGHVIWQMQADYELRLTQDWVLLLDGELAANAQNNIQAMSGSGIAESAFSVRIACQRIRKLVPYVGIEWERSYGNTRDYREQAGEAGSEWLGLAGVNIWY